MPTAWRERTRALPSILRPSDQRPMLHDPARHEALRPIAWDESRVRATIARIVDETVAAFSPETLWPPHPRDLNAGDDPDAPVTCLYHGAAGVV